MTAQVGVGADDVGLLVAVGVVLVGLPEVEGVVVGFVGVVVVPGNEVAGFEVVGVDVGAPDVVDDDSLKERYQLDLSVSPRHSPTVTPFQPLFLMTSK